MAMLDIPDGSGDGWLSALMRRITEGGAAPDQLQRFDPTFPGNVPMPMARPQSAPAFPMPQPRPESAPGMPAIPLPQPRPAEPAIPLPQPRPQLPAWPGMLSAPLPADMAAGGYPAAPPAPAPAPAALPPASAPASSAADTPASVPPTSLAGRMDDVLSKVQNWTRDNRSTLMALGAGMAGAQNLGQGLSRGMAAAIPAQQADIKQQQLNQSLPIIRDRLIKSGIPAADASGMAMAAIGNPAIMQQIVPGLFGAKQRQFTQIGEDMLGNKKYGFVDPVANKVYDLSGKELTGESAGGTTVPNGPDGQPLSGQALLQHLEKNDPVTAAGIKGLISGDLNAQGRNLQKLAPVASLVDPTFDAAQYPVRLATRKSYTSGKDFQETQALNTVSGHMGRLMDSADGLGNYGWKPINTIKNWYADTFTGSPELVKFRNALVTTQNELAKAYHGGHVSDSAYAAFNKSINEAQTPAEMKAAIGEIAGLLQSKIEAKESGYRSSMGQAPLPSEFKAINDEARHSFQKIGDWARGVKPAPEAPAHSTATPAPAAVPKPGGKYEWTRDRGLVLVQ